MSTSANAAKWFVPLFAAVTITSRPQALPGSLASLPAESGAAHESQ